MSQFPGLDRPLKVLHVDDDPLNLRVVQEILGAFGHTAISVANGHDALARLGEEVFDVLLLDIHMPGMTGLEVIQRVRASKGAERSTPVIALTADVVSRRPQEYLALGFNDYVSKPILISALMTALQRAAQMPAPSVMSRAS